MQTIVVVGFSFGGIEGLPAFFENIEEGNISYVLIWHIPFNSKSHLKEILQKHTGLEIIVAEDCMRVASNKIYLMPTDNYLTILDNTFCFHERNGTDKRIMHVIDFFLESFSLERNVQKIVIIMSGAGSDGSRGSKLVKDNGGVIIVQSPETCISDSMPAAVINSVNVDVISSLGNMSTVINSYVKNA